MSGVITVISGSYGLFLLISCLVAAWTARFCDKRCMRRREPSPPCLCLDHGPSLSVIRGLDGVSWPILRLKHVVRGLGWDIVDADEVFCE